MQPRKRWMWTVVTLALAWSPAGFPAVGAENVLFRENFEVGLDAEWIERGFPSIGRKNVFTLAVENDGNHYLRVESDRSTSGRGVQLKFDVHRCPLLSWRWRVSAVIAKADLRTKEGDDAAAKIYVVLDGPSRWNPMDKRLLVYVWDNRLPAGTVLPNAWQPDRARMVVLESGVQRVGQWVDEQVDLARDYARAFPGEEGGSVAAFAFMADTDNTSARVHAGVDDLQIRCLTPAGGDVSGQP